MTTASRLGVLSLLLCAGFSIAWGSALGLTGWGTTDFRAVYYGTRCLLQHHNPYSASDLEGVYLSEGGKRPNESAMQRQAVTRCINLPTTFLFVAPFAMLPFGAAQALWLMLLAAGFLLAAFMALDLCAGFAPGVSHFLICIVLANSIALFGGGNTAGIAVSLCLIAVWCFLKERFVTAGILCMAISLAIKPHDTGLVWLYFLLTGGACRKRALRSLILTAAMALSALVWVSRVAPHWMHDWNSNLAVTSGAGGINAPGPASSAGFNNLSMVIDLQTLIAVFRNDPRIYNAASYMICGALLLVWSIATLRSRFSPDRALFALAPVVPLSLLVTYHHLWDAKLLLLTVPACAMLWGEKSRIRWLSLLVSVTALASTGDIPVTVLQILTRNLHISAAGISGQLMTVLTARPVPLVLLGAGVFYLWVYVRRAAPDAAKMSIESAHPAPAAG